MTRWPFSVSVLYELESNWQQGVSWVDQVNVGLSTFDFRNTDLDCTRGYPWVIDFYNLEAVPRVRKLPGHDLNTQNTEREAVQFVSVDRRLP